MGLLVLVYQNFFKMKNQLNVSKIIVAGFVIGIVLSLMSYGGLYLSIQLIPEIFTQYNNPLFNSNGNRDALFYSHAFVISQALSWSWAILKSQLKGNILIRGISFGLIYAVIALLPVMWITFSSLDISFEMVASWFTYGFMQAVIAGVLFAKFYP